jgi:DNA-binding HxlR family transcriptional regulator
MVFQTYLENIPDFIVDYFKIIKNSFRVKIMKTLFEQDSISFSKLEALTLKPTGYIAKHIHQLERANIVQNYITKKQDSRDYSFYRFTEIGKVFYRYYFILDSKKILDISLDKNIIKSLANKFRFGLLLYLIENEDVSFSTLKTETKREGGNLTHHLHLLERSHLIQNVLRKTKESSDFSYYKITSLGEDFVSITTELYNLSIGKREYLEDFLGRLVNHNEQYTKLLPSKFEVDMNSTFSAHFASWALPNEPILGWINILNKNVNKIVLSFSEDIQFSNSYNNATIKFSEGINEAVIDNVLENKIDYYSIVLRAEIPKSSSIINPENINIKVFDENEVIIEEQLFTIDIIKPLIELTAKKTDISSKSGYFNILLKIPKGYNLRIGEMHIIAKNSEGKILDIKKEEISPMDFPTEIPHEIETNDLIGHIKFHGSGPFYVKFSLEYFDAVNNEYKSESSELKILASDLNQNLLNLNYNFYAASVGA